MPATAPDSMAARRTATRKTSRLIRGIGCLWTGEAFIRDAAVLIEGSRVAWVGRLRDAPDALENFDANGAIGMPGLVDCHTHAVYAGTRLGDFVRRSEGETYTEILEGGGGIHTTVSATRACKQAELIELTRARLAGMFECGVTTVEIKSGYGLTTVHEARILRAARAAAGPIEVVTTFLGAHAIPPDQDRGRYVDEVCGPMLAMCTRLADGIDVYCDRGAFTLTEAARILAAGRDAGLSIRVHAEQVEHTGIAAVAARMGALSADHLERIDTEGIEAMADNGTVAVLLPAAMMYLRDSPPPVGALRDARVRMAVATDLNPGSSPVPDLWAAATLAVLTMGLSPTEALAGITIHAARALGRDDIGRIAKGSAGDIALFEPPPGEAVDPRVLVQYLGGHKAWAVFKGGTRVR